MIDVKQVQQILRDHWNPIACPGLPDDEYDYYVPAVMDLLRFGADAVDVFDYLCYVENRCMELPLSPSREAVIAEVVAKLVKLTEME
jgi:hypothetical protein